MKLLPALKSPLTWLILLGAAMKIFSLDKHRVEKVYSQTLYPPIGRALRTVTGFFPFSIGDMIYTLFWVALAWLLFSTLRKLFRQPLKMTTWKPWLYQGTLVVLSIYVLFNLLWGLNYNRKGIAWQLGLQKKEYDSASLIRLAVYMQLMANRERQTIGDNPFPSKDSVFLIAQEAYRAVSGKYTFLNYSPASMKPSLYSWFGKYGGYTGYYNPFTGEAQLNTEVPAFLHPFIAVHEIGHQLGYARENEANFVGFLAAESSSDSRLRYSAYIDMYMYLHRSVFRLDSNVSKRLYRNLDTLARRDLREYREYLRRTRNPVEPYIRWMYDKYLRANDQPQGLLTYNEVIGELMEYYRRKGVIR
jgi:Protein of unknown function (DUF3810)